jgi:catechol 2,3-dioxygenase-like lactoylglutathione lyase family enzyme
MNHMSFTVSNLEKSIEFYQKILGLELVNKSERDIEFSEKVTGIQGAKLVIAYLKTSNCAVELIQYLSPQGIRLDTKTCNIGSAHVCFIVAEFQKMVGKLKENNVRFSGKPTIIPAGPNKGKAVLYFEDNDSNTIEIISKSVVRKQRRTNEKNQNRY